MAILHGETAKWPKKQAERRFHVIVLIVAGMSMAMGIVLGMLILQRQLVWTIVLLAAAIGLLVILARFTDKPLRKLGKERIRHWRGAQAESLVAWIIRDELDNCWHLFNSVKLQQDWDIDHILVGPGGVFAISTKSLRGCFALASDGILLLNGKPTHHARQAFTQALELRSRLEALMGADVPFVQPILAAPFAYTDLAEKSQKTWILHQESMIDTFEREANPPRLNRAQLRRTLQSIETLARNAEQLWSKVPPNPKNSQHPTKKETVM